MDSTIRPLAALPWRALLLWGLMVLGPVRANAQDLSADTIQALESRIAALEDAFRQSIVLTAEDCSALGPGWGRFDAAAGRFLLAANPESDSGNPDLANRTVRETGGAESVTLQTRHTPRHVHDLSIEDHTHTVDMRSRSLNLQRAGAGGRTVSLRALERGGSTRTSRGATAATSTRSLPEPESLDVMPPFFVANACRFTEGP